MKLTYKNIGTVPKKFHGVEFKPGETKSVDGYINANSFIRVDTLPNPRNTKTPPTTNAEEAKSTPKIEAKKPEPEAKKQETKKDDTASNGTADIK